MGFRNADIRDRIQAMQKKFIAFGIREMTAWEKAGLVRVPDKEKAAATILALSEGFGILRNSLKHLDSLGEIARTMRQSALDALGAGSVDLDNGCHVSEPEAIRSAKTGSEE
jgi:hypothetical protein